MAIDKLGAAHLATRGFEVQRTNNFEIDISGLVGSGFSSSEIDHLKLAVVSGFLPSESNEVISLNYGNTTITVAGKANLNGSGSLVVRDLVEKDTEALIDRWRALVTDKSDDSIGFAAAYKKAAKLVQYAPDGTYIRSWDLVGVWPSAVEYGQISYDSPGVKTISITLQYDKATLDRKEYTAR